jgi:hypothetical protein
VRFPIVSEGHLASNARTTAVNHAGPMWEATLQSEDLRQCRRERHFTVYGLLGRMLPGLEGQ